MIATKINKKKAMWLKILLIFLLIILLVISGFYCAIRFSCKSIADRGVFIASSKGMVFLSESADFTKVDIDELKLKDVEVFKSKENINIYGYDAKAYYVFWRNTLYWAYFLIENTPIEKFDEIKEDLRDILSDDYYVRDEGEFDDLYRKNISLHGIKTLDPIQNIHGVYGDLYTCITYGYNYFPVDKDLYEKVCDREYESLVEQDTFVIEYSSGVSQRILKENIVRGEYD